MDEEEFRSTFENGGFWELYSDLERSFCVFLEYVPYLSGNKMTYSFKLLNLLNSIGGHIDSAFKEMARYSFQDSSDNDRCQRILKRARKQEGIFETSVDVFNTIYGISSKKVTFKCLPDRETVIPFSGECREWWKFYNAVKHEVGFYLTKANLKNIRDALAGAFLLNVIHILGALRLRKYGILNEKSEIPDWIFEKDIKRHEKVRAEVTTPLFIYDFDQ